MEAPRQKCGLRGSRGGLPLSGSQWASACLLSTAQPNTETELRWLTCPAKPSTPLKCYSFCLPRSTRRSRRISQSNYIDHGISYPVVDQREELPLLPFGNPIGAVPAASRGVSLIIKFYFVSFVIFVVVFLSRYNLPSLCENVECGISPFLRSESIGCERCVHFPP